jgi:hypothetical protein
MFHQKHFKLVQCQKALKITSCCQKNFELDNITAFSIRINPPSNPSGVNKLLTYFGPFNSQQSDERQINCLEIQINETSSISLK